MDAAIVSALVEGREIALPVGRSGRSALEVARGCSAIAGEILRSSFERAGPVAVEWKGPRDPVTQTDYEAQEAVLSHLRQEFPEHHILSEEAAGEVVAEGWQWVVDPLDGTRNFVAGVPHFAFNLALCRDGAPLLGLTLDPILREEFLAVRGRGAWVNGEALRASEAASLAEGMVAAGLGYDMEAGTELLERLLRLLPGIQTLRLAGSAALDLAYAAAGRFDLLVHCDVHPWDVAAGIVLVQEAGGAITDGAGGPTRITERSVVAGGRGIHGDYLSRGR